MGRAREAGIRKRVIITAVFAGVVGIALGLVAGAYMGFWATRYVVQVPLYERSVSGAADSSIYWQMALDGKTETIRHLARGAALMHAGTLDIVYDDLEKGQRMSVDRSFRRILELVERDDEAIANYSHTIDSLSETTFGVSGMTEGGATARWSARPMRIISPVSFTPIRKVSEQPWTTDVGGPSGPILCWTRIRSYGKSVELELLRPFSYFPNPGLPTEPNQGLPTEPRHRIRYGSSGTFRDIELLRLFNYFPRHRA